MVPEAGLLGQVIDVGFVVSTVANNYHWDTTSSVVPDVTV
jgi:hypothetical protein